MKTLLTEKDAEAVYDFSPDSLTIIEISMALEERFNLSIPDESWERIKTVGELLELVAGLLEQSK